MKLQLMQHLGRIPEFNIYLQVQWETYPTNLLYILMGILSNTSITCKLDNLLATFL